jgi:ectoine hydroxylase-related dioxygenase (phytanoyl-CoA dioxygenase family)
VQVPTAVLERMVTLRVHLDAADVDNGALWVAPGPQRLGYIGAESAVLEQCGMRACAVSAGDALLMRPLLLHASRKSTSPWPPRVVHLEFAAADALPPPLEWAESA